MCCCYHDAYLLSVGLTNVIVPSGWQCRREHVFGDGRCGRDTKRHPCLWWGHHPREQCRYIAGQGVRCHRLGFRQLTRVVDLQCVCDRFKNMSDAEFDQVISVHIKGAYACTRAAWPHFRNQKFGRIINASSAAGIYGTCSAEHVVWLLKYCACA